MLHFYFVYEKRDYLSLLGGMGGLGSIEGEGGVYVMKREGELGGGLTSPLD